MSSIVKKRNFKIVGGFIVVAALSLFGFQNCQRSSFGSAGGNAGFSVPDPIQPEPVCNLTSPDLLLASQSPAYVGTPVEFKISLSNCDTGILKSATFRVAGPSAADPVLLSPGEFKYEFSKIGLHTITANYLVESADGKISDRSLELKLAVEVKICQAHESSLILPVGAAIGRAVQISLDMSACDQQSRPSIEWFVEGGLIKYGPEQGTIQATFAVTGVHAVKAKLVYPDGREAKIIAGSIQVVGCAQCQPGPNEECLASPESESLKVMLCQEETI